MKNGPYILVKAPADFPGKKYRGVYAYEHTVVWWLHTRIIPPEGYQIHHKNECRTDNRFENLEMVFKRTHMKLHMSKKERAITLLICDACKKPFQIQTRNYTVKKNQGQEHFYCSRACDTLRKSQIPEENRKFTTLTCDYCKNEFKIQNNWLRARQKKGQQLFHCSRSCQLYNRPKIKECKELIYCTLAQR